MPYRISWVAPELFFELKGVRVYRTYADNNVEAGVNSFWFTLHELCDLDECECEGDAESCRRVFDVRELPDWRESLKPSERREELKYVRSTIVRAIERGHITAQGLNARQP